MGIGRPVVVVPIGTSAASYIADGVKQSIKRPMHPRVGIPHASPREKGNRNGPAREPLPGLI